MGDTEAMGERSSGDFGRRLRAARERRGLSLRQISDTTKIGIAVLEGLEHDDISRLPGGIFSRGIVRSYAAEVGLDPEATMQEFTAQFSRDAVTVGHVALSQPEDHLAVESDRHVATTFVRLIAISVPIAVAVVYFGSIGRVMPAAVSPVIPQPSPAVQRSEPIVSEPAPAAVEVAATTGTTAPDHLRVTVSALRECWVSATVDGGKAFEGVLQSGDVHAFDARELELTAGDAAALVLTINGEAARPLGRDGQVVTMRLNLTNFHEYVAPR
jgi:cytoskeleton protein RodZ